MSETTVTAASASPSRVVRDPNNVQFKDLDMLRFVVVCGSLSVVENIFFYPFHLIKTREQADRSAISGAGTRGAWKVTASHVLLCYQMGGVRSLYQGFVASSVSFLPCYPLYLLAYSYCKSLLGWSAHDESLWSRYAVPIVSGVVADVLAMALYVPADIVVQRLQLQAHLTADQAQAQAQGHAQVPAQRHRARASGLGLLAARSIWHQEGIRGFYRGSGAAVVHSTLASAAWWTAYENSKRYLHTQLSTRADDRAGEEKGGEGEAEVERLPQVGAGLVAGAVTAVVSNPMDVVKTRLQTQRYTQMLFPQQSQYRSVWHAFAVIYKEEGPSSFTRGLLPKALSRMPLGAISSVLYEMMFFYGRKPVEHRTSASTSSL